MNLTPIVKAKDPNDYRDENFCIGGDSLRWMLNKIQKLEDYDVSGILEILKTKALITGWGFKPPARLDKLLEMAIAEQLQQYEKHDAAGTKRGYWCHGVEFTKEEVIRALELDGEDPPKGDKIWYLRYFEFVNNDALTEEESETIIRNVDFGMLLKNSCPTDIKNAIQEPFEITDTAQMHRVLVANAYLKGDLKMHDNFLKHITWEVLHTLTNKQFKALMDKFSFFPRGTFDEARVRARIFSTLMNKTAGTDRNGENKNQQAERLKAVCYFLSDEKRYTIWRLLKDENWFKGMALLELEMNKVVIPKDIFGTLNGNDDNDTDYYHAAVFLEMNQVPKTMGFGKEHGFKSVEYETKADVQEPAAAVAPCPATDPGLLAATPA